jgi:hypothetical protein
VSPKAKTSKPERGGDVVDVARELLADGRSNEVLSLVTKLAEQNAELATQAAVAATRASAAISRAAELERQLEQIQARYKKNEAVSKAQLVLILDAISRGEAGDVPADDGDPRPKANDRLREAAGITAPQDDEPKTRAPRERPLWVVGSSKAGLTAQGRELLR